MLDQPSQWVTRATTRETICNATIVQTVSCTHNTYNYVLTGTKFFEKSFGAVESSHVTLSPHHCYLAGDRFAYAFWLPEMLLLIVFRRHGRISFHFMVWHVQQLRLADAARIPLTLKNVCYLGNFGADDSRAGTAVVVRFSIFHDWRYFCNHNKTYTCIRHEMEFEIAYLRTDRV